MELSFLLGKIMGITLIIIGLSVIFNKKLLKKAVEDLAISGGLMFMTGFVMLLLGIIVIVAHNIWVWGWPVIVTILGWCLLLRGVFMLFLSSKFITFINNMILKRYYQHLAWIMIVVGLYLSYMAF